MRIYVVSWAHACFRRLKHMNDKFTYFIDLDSYLDKFIFNSVKTAELVAGRRAIVTLLKLPSLVRAWAAVMEAGIVLYC